MPYYGTPRSRDMLSSFNARADLLKQNYPLNRKVNMLMYALDPSV